MSDATTFKTATIAAAGTTSNEVELGNSTAVGLDVPTIDTGNLTFTVARVPGGTFQALKDMAGNTVTVVAGTGAAYFALDPALFAGVRALKIVAATQASAREIIVVSRPVG